MQPLLQLDKLQSWPSTSVGGLPVAIALSLLSIGVGSKFEVQAMLCHAKRC